VVIAGLTVLAVLGFLAVNRLVHRFDEQQKALARHLYDQGMTAQAGGRPDRAIESFRDALVYSRDNFQYQLSLARALRDSGRTEEAQTYLISLWERSPQDAAVNLALGRLAARQELLDNTLQYYHSAIYGIWGNDANTTRLDAWFELVEFLLARGAFPQAQAELITLATVLPQNPELHLRAADLLLRAQDYDHALAEYQRVLLLDHANAAAQAGAGEAAFRQGRYRTAQRYLQSAVRANPEDAQASRLLQTSNLILDSNPFNQRLSNAERNRRIESAFNQAGNRLESCTPSQGVSAGGTLSIDQFTALKAQWNDMKMKVKHLGGQSESDTADAAMDLVFEIEEQAAKECSAPSGFDEALLLLAQDRAGVDR
jgi:tetratricopeptide (TPR) repeat protein